MCGVWSMRYFYHHTKYACFKKKIPFKIIKTKTKGYCCLGEIKLLLSPQSPKYAWKHILGNSSPNPSRGTWRLQIKAHYASRQPTFLNRHHSPTQLKSQTKRAAAKSIESLAVSLIPPLSRLLSAHSVNQHRAPESERTQRATNSRRAFLILGTKQLNLLIPPINSAPENN